MKIVLRKEEMTSDEWSAIQSILAELWEKRQKEGVSMDENGVSIGPITPYEKPTIRSDNRISKTLLDLKAGESFIVTVNDKKRFPKIRSAVSGKASYHGKKLKRLYKTHIESDTSFRVYRVK